MRGYQNDYSRSNRAAMAEEAGLLPASRITQAWCDEHGISEKAPFVKWLIRLGALDADEWHHTSKRYNRTDYYSGPSIARQLAERDFGDETTRGSLAFFRALYQQPNRPKSYFEYANYLSKGTLDD